MLTIHTVKETFIVDNPKDAENILNEFNRISMHADEVKWTEPIKLQNGKYIFFVLDNIIAVEYE